MNVTEALDRIEEIHAHIAKGEIYRGYRPIPVALSGMLGITAALMQPRFVGEHGGAHAFLAYWVAIAAINLVLNMATIVTGYLREQDAFARRHTRQVVSQFVPCVAAGAAITAGLPMGGEHLVVHLPGMWAILFSLGLFASRPYLPRATGWVALFFLIAGGAVLASPIRDLSWLGLATGGIFGLGQLSAAIVLQRNVPRPDDA